MVGPIAQRQNVRAASVIATTVPCCINRSESRRRRLGIAPRSFRRPAPPRQRREGRWTRPRRTSEPSNRRRPAPPGEPDEDRLRGVSSFLVSLLVHAVLLTAAALVMYGQDERREAGSRLRGPVNEDLDQPTLLEAVAAEQLLPAGDAPSEADLPQWAQSPNAPNVPRPSRPPRWPNCPRYPST